MHLKTIYTKNEHRDSGLALTLITLIAGFYFHQLFFFKAALAEIAVLLIAPVLVYPFSFLWLNLSDMLGKVMSKIILTFVFFLFVWPVGFVRRVMNKDTLRLKNFRKDKASVFTERNHNFEKADFTTPF